MSDDDIKPKPINVLSTSAFCVICQCFVPAGNQNCIYMNSHNQCYLAANNRANNTRICLTLPHTEPYHVLYQ